MTPIQQLIKVATRNTPSETGMWVAENLNSLTQRERETLETVWNTAVKSIVTGATFSECYDKIIHEEFIKPTSKTPEPIKINFSEAKQRVRMLVEDSYMDIANDTILEIKKHSTVTNSDDLDTITGMADVLTWLQRDRETCLDYIDQECHTIYDLLKICDDEDNFPSLYENNDIVLATILGVETIETKY
jgi:hypothetical protein